MKGILYINNEQLGEVDFEVIDESMGVIGGYLIANSSYDKYKPFIRKQSIQKGISNSTDFDYRIIVEDNTELNPEGGIGITDLEEIDEIYVEAAGLAQSIIRKCC